jgi:DNA polymerase-3 subunit gamma/tau
VTDVRRLWPEVLEEVKGRRRFTWILLSQNAHVADVSGGTLLLAMPNAGARDSFGKGGNEDILREALIVVLGVDLAVSTMVDPSAGGGGSRQPTTGRPTPPRSEATTGGPPPAGAGERSGGAAGPAVPGEAVLAQARQAIRPTRNGPRAEENDDRDAAADRDDADVDESDESHTELLARQLGAQIIAEEEHGT